MEFHLRVLLACQIYEWMTDWMNEWLNEWMNEWMNELNENWKLFIRIPVGVDTRYRKNNAYRLKHICSLFVIESVQISFSACMQYIYFAELFLICMYRYQYRYRICFILTLWRQEIKRAPPEPFCVKVFCHKIR